MVMRPFRNIPISKQKASFSFSRNVSSSTNHTHQFFNPSYISPKDLIKLDEIHHSSSSSKNCNKSIFKYVAPALSLTKNYVIFNNNNNDHQTAKGNNHNQLLTYDNRNNQNFQTVNSTLDDKILLRKLNYKGNKNSRLNITIDSVNDNHTILNVRRANSNNIKKITIPNKQGKRSYSSNVKTDELEHDLSKLTINDVAHDEKHEVQHVKFIPNDQNLNSTDDPLDSFLYENPIQTQEVIIDSMLSLGKFNEVLPVFNRMRNNGIIPTVEIYNKVLKSIQLRETDETLETNLTHLLNTYSDMLSNNLKPNNQTYELIIDNLIKGSIKSYQMANLKSGYEFFKIAFELFLINQQNTDNIFKNNNVYLNLLTCLNYLKLADLIAPQELFKMLKDKISSSNKIEFYVQLIKFATLSKDLQFIEDIYNNNVKSLNTGSKNDKIYQELIQSYNLCNELKKSSLLLDTIINNLPNKESLKTQQLLTQYLSVYVRSLSLVDPTLAFNMVHKFNSITWLPDLSIESLLMLSYSFLRLNDLSNSLKVWDFIIIRSDFDFEFTKLLGSNNNSTNEFSIFISNFHNQLLQSILNSGDKNLILKSIREVLCKNSLILDDSLLVNIIRYLNSIQNEDLVTKLVINQGYKKSFQQSSEMKKESLSNYLSLLVDFIPNNQITNIFNSKFFKKVIEEYRLLTDNIYGILKIFNVILSSDNTNSTLKLNLKYYSKVLDYEFNDVDNCYVQIPNEIINFKQDLKQYI